MSKNVSLWKISGILCRFIHKVVPLITHSEAMFKLYDKKSTSRNPNTLAYIRINSTLLTHSSELCNLIHCRKLGWLERFIVKTPWQYPVWVFRWLPSLIKMVEFVFAWPGALGGWRFQLKDQWNGLEWANSAHPGNAKRTQPMPSQRQSVWGRHTNPSRNTIWSLTMTLPTQREMFVSKC
jgi:hypothetical protein